MSYWDYSNLKPQRDFVLPTMPPFFVGIFDTTGQQVLWFARPKGSKLGNWVKVLDEHTHIEIRWKRWMDCKHVMARLLKENNAKALKEAGYPPGEYRCILINPWQKEKVMSFEVFVE